MEAAVRRSAVAGSWYPDSADALIAEVEAYLAGASPPPIPGELVGLVSPHAGLAYSGPVAAHGYSLLRGRRDLTVVLVGPTHRSAFPGVSLWARGAFDTPLGRLPVDEELAAALLSGGRISDAREPHLAEHSLEMQLPFLAHLVEGLRIVPLLMGRQDRSAVEALSEDLARAAGSRDDVVLAASSDLSHFHPASIANELDARVVDRVAGYDDDGLMDLLETNHEHACGGGPIACVMKAARALGADAATILRYADSGDEVTHDKSRVVGYLSAALSRTAA